MAELYRQNVTTLAQALERSRDPHQSHGGAPRPHRRHRPDPRRGRAGNRAERESRGDAGGGPKCEEVARKGRPLATSCDGCGGSQPTLLTLATRGLSQRATVFQACSFKVRTWPAAVTSRHARRRLFPPPCLPSRSASAGATVARASLPGFGTDAAGYRLGNETGATLLPRQTRQCPQSRVLRKRVIPELKMLGSRISKERHRPAVVRDERVAPPLPEHVLSAA